MRMLEYEEWRPVAGYPYDVSSLGRVRRTGKARGARVGHVLIPNRMNIGYLSVNLTKHNEKTGRTYLHDVVCTAFHGPRPTPEHEVAHWDGDRANCRSDNLRWATRKQNLDDMVRHGTRRSGTKHHSAKLTDNQVKEIRSRAASGRRVNSRLAKEFGVSPSVIWAVVHKKSWAHVI